MNVSRKEAGKTRPGGDGESGAAMVEFALVFPVQLLVFLLGLQLCLIVMAKQLVNYAAFCAARAYIVREPEEDAAAIALTPIGGLATDGKTYPSVDFPGWAGSGEPNLDVLSQRAREKVDVEVLESMETYGQTEEGRVVVEVRFAYEMMIPLANWVIYYGLDAIHPGLVHFMPLSECGSYEKRTMESDEDSIPEDAIGVLVGDVPHIVLTEKGVMPSYQRLDGEIISKTFPHDVCDLTYYFPELDQR